MGPLSFTALTFYIISEYPFAAKSPLRCPDENYNLAVSGIGKLWYDLIYILKVFSDDSNQGIFCSSYIEKENPGPFII